MKILITGAAGFIASHIVDAYIDKGHEVVVLDNLSTGKKENLNPKAKFYQVDVTDERAVAEIFQKEKPDVVNHHAAQKDVRASVAEPIFDAKTNILGIINLLENCPKHKVKKFIFASTGGALYGEAEKIPTPENYPTWPLSPYGIAKIASEYYLYFYHAQYGLPYLAFRYANVYGPRQDPHGEAGVVAIFGLKLLKNEQPIINGDGRQTRDYVYIKDVVQANLLALKSDKIGSYNIGIGIETDANEIFRQIKKATGSSLPEKHGPAKAGEQKRSALDTTKAQRELHWTPKYSLDKGIEETVDWFRS